MSCNTGKYMEWGDYGVTSQHQGPAQLCGHSLLPGALDLKPPTMYVWQVHAPTVCLHLLGFLQPSVQNQAGKRQL